MALTVGLIVYVALVAESTTTHDFNNTTFDLHGSSLDRQQKPGFNGVTLFHF